MMIQKPSDAVLVMLASLVDHNDEQLGLSGDRFFDEMSIRGIITHPDVVAWLNSVPEALRVEKRKSI